jgi:predicted GIY-YIG superfamily endonuclease
MIVDATTPDADLNWFRSSSGISWRVVGAPAERVPAPDDLLANVEHVLRVTAKIATLTDALQDAINATAVAAERWRSSGAHPRDMENVYQILRDGSVPGRGAMSPILRNPKPHPAPDAGVPVVYVLLRRGTIVYVGQSTDVKSRVSSHRRTKSFDAVELYVCDSQLEAADLEAVLIDQHRPQYNKRIERRNGAAV